MVAEDGCHPGQGGAGPPPRALRGRDRVTVQHPETGFTVARLIPERGPDGADRAADRRATLVGTLPGLQPAAAIAAPGWWHIDLKDGWSFHAVAYRTTLPANPQGMKRDLGSDLVEGIGPVMAARIVDAFGAATFDVIDGAVERLTAAPGIGPKRAARIAAAWDRQRHVRQVMAALQGYGISTLRISKKFGGDRARVIAPAPHRLARRREGSVSRPPTRSRGRSASRPTRRSGRRASRSAHVCRPAPPRSPVPRGSRSGSPHTRRRLRVSNQRAPVVVPDGDGKASGEGARRRFMVRGHRAARRRPRGPARHRQRAARPVPLRRARTVVLRTRPSRPLSRAPPGDRGPTTRLVYQT